MTSLLHYFVSLVLSFFLGVSYIEPQDKPFLKGNYYQDKIDTVNYLDIYSGTLDSGNDEEQCNTGRRMFNSNSNRKRIQDSKSSGFLFFATSSDTLENAISNTEKDDKLSAYVYKVPKGTEIIAPYKCTVVNSSLSSYENLYPEDSKGKTLGSYIQVITEETDNGDQFRITIGSIARHWCCMSKTEPSGYTIEGDKNTPYYKHTYTPNETYKFDAGDVIAEAGQTGVPKSIRDQNSDAFIYIKVEKKIFGGTFMPATISDLYQ